jgi:dTDP-4-amino-4,6-dideoxygalactose transaminase
MPATTKKIPYVDLAGQHEPLKAELMDAVAHVIDHGKFILGDEVALFEQRFAALCGVNYAVGVNSGTDALIIALRVLGIGPGDEVITPVNSFVASASCVALCGAKPVLVDVREDYNIDPAQARKAITSKTRAIIPVHLTGRPADMDSILDIAQKHKLFVVEDSAQAVLAEYRGKRVGSFGSFGCFSLHPLKTLNACGDGGVLTTNDLELYEQAKLLRNLGLATRDNCVVWSGNSRLDTIQAAMLLVKLKHVEAWTEKRRQNAAFYQRALKEMKDLTIPADREPEKAVYHTFIVQAERRDELKQFLAENGIETSIHYPLPIHLQRAAASLGWGSGSFPRAERQAGKILSLPIYPELEESDLAYVADRIKEFYR